MWFKAEFSVSFLQSSVSQDPLKSILICRFAAQETIDFIIIAIPFLLQLGLKWFKTHVIISNFSLVVYVYCMLHLEIQ